MSGIISRTPFLEDTAGLFTDERVATARTKIIEWLNDIAVGEAGAKVDALLKIQEIIINSCLELLDEFLDNILALAHDPSQEVRRAVVGFIEQICKARIEYLPRVITVLAMLLRDESPQVIKRVTQSCAAVYKNAIQWICSSIDITESVEEAWNTLSMMKALIVDMIDNENEGIRTNAVKFLEGVVILQTYPDEDSMKREKDFSLEDVPMTLKLARRRKLEDEALNIFDCLLKFHAAVHISSVNLIACTGSLCTIAKMRPSLMAPVVEAIKKLSTNLPPTLTDSQMSNVRKHLKLQLLNLLKNRGCFEMQSQVISLLQELGASSQEISRAIPKMDKQEQLRRSKRALENAGMSANKRARTEKEPQPKPMPVDGRPMEIDYEELEAQKVKSTKINEKFIGDFLKNLDVVVQLVMGSMKNLPGEAPQHFVSNYSPIVDMSVPQQINRIAFLLGDQMTEQKIGPGNTAFTKEPPMRPCAIVDMDKGGKKDDEDNDAEMIEFEDDSRDENQRKEEATRKLRETMERAKEEQAMIQRMKARVKTLKLQEVTKPLTRSLKESFMVEAIKRILRAERQCIVGGVSAKRRKILTVMAATFPDNCRDVILEFILQDVKNRLDLAFSWLYEEYCLLQGFTRHSYIKSENKPDYAYNKLLAHLITGIYEKTDSKERAVLLRRVYLEAPIIPEEAVQQLVEMIEAQEMSYHCLELVKDLTLRKPPKKHTFLRILLTYCVHENLVLRERALDNIITLYAVHKILTNKIEEFALEWLGFLEKETPPPKLFSKEYGRPEPEIAWNEEITKVCLTVFLALMPYHEGLIQNLARVYTETSADLKRTILRSIESSIKKMGPDSFEILRLIEQCPKGVETLITRIVYILTERSMPTPDLVNRVRELYKTKVQDVRLLIPVLGGLTKTEILTALPKFLKLNPVVVKEVFNRLLGIGAEFANQTMPVTSADILIALHTIDISKCELKFIVKATSICLAEKDVYTQETLINCLQQLAEIVPTPTLLMRTVIQSLTLYPKMAQFIVNLLLRLILKQVWKQKVIWDGFLKCCQRLKPDSLPVLLHLPSPQLQDALTQCPDLRQPLLEYAESMEGEMGSVSKQTMDILLGNALDVFVTDETGGYIQPENIKKEREDPEVFASSGQPLPPGED